MARKKASKTQSAIRNINSYINKIGDYFGIGSAEYEAITNQLTDLETYTNKKGYTVISNNAANRRKHQKIRSISKKKTKFSTLKKRYEKLKQDLFEDVTEFMEEIEEEYGDFDTWFKNWKKEWKNKEQYEVSDAADELGLDFDYERWYTDYEYRQQMRDEIYEGYRQQALNNIPRSTNDEGDTVNSETGDVYTYTEEDVAIPGFERYFDW